jgi:hypothetical protein
VSESGSITTTIPSGGAIDPLLDVVLAKPLADGDYAVTLFNESPYGSATISTSTTAIGLGSAPNGYTLTNLWTNAVTTTGGAISANVPPEGVVMYDVSPSPTGTLTGDVTNASGGAALANMCVYLYPVGVSTNASYATCTGANGTYALNGVAPGSYDVAFADPAGVYATQWYNATSGGAATQSGASAVTLTGGQLTSGIDAALSQVAQGAVSGTVTDASGGAGLTNMCVYLYPVGVSSAASYASCSTSGGSYQIGGVASGSYDVAFADPSGAYTTQWYTGSAGGASSQSGAVAITVPSGNQTLSGINAALSQVAQGAVSGTVTDAGSGTGLANMCVYLYPVGVSSAASYASCSTAGGNYQIGGVAPGSYDVAFADPNGVYVTQWYNGTSRGSASQAGATAVQVLGGNQTTSGINASMTP